MPRCINHNDRETITFCVNCEDYICDECKESWEGKNFCKRCFTKPILNYYSSISNLHAEKKSFYIKKRPTLLCVLSIFLGIIGMFVGLISCLILIDNGGEGALNWMLASLFLGFIFLKLGIKCIQMPKKSYHRF